MMGAPLLRLLVSPVSLRGGLPIPHIRYPRREPTDDWQQLRLLLKDPAQISYEIIRPVILFGVSPKERAEETGISRRAIYYKANLFDQADMASLLPPEPLPPVPKLDKRTLPPPMRQALVDLKAEYPALSIHELATICYVQFGQRPGAQTIKLVLAAGPAPSRQERRFPHFAQMLDATERRLAIVRLHAEGWTPSSIAGYLETSRQTVYTTLKKWVAEQFAGLAPQSHAPQHPATKTTLRAIQEVKHLQENPELGEYRVSAAFEQLGISSRRAPVGAFWRSIGGCMTSSLHRREAAPRRRCPLKPNGGTSIGASTFATWICTAWAMV